MVRAVTVWEDAEGNRRETREGAEQIDKAIAKRRTDAAVAEASSFLASKLWPTYVGGSQRTMAKAIANGWDAVCEAVDKFRSKPASPTDLAEIGCRNAQQKGDPS